MQELQPIDREEILEILDTAEKIFKSEKILLEVDTKETFLIGDIHGDLESATKIFKIYSKTKENFIFLGDYVDRGAFSTEVIVGLLRLKIENPERIILLRGNHETTLANQTYGFLEELQRKYPEGALKLYTRFNQVFAQMPIAAIVNSEILCLHGGIPKNTTINEIKKIPKGDTSGEHPILLQVLWNDPDETVEYYEASYRGPGIFLFGHKAFQEFMEKHGLKKMIRAHTFIAEGAKWYFNNNLLSLFSPINYVGRIINAKIAKLDQKNIRIISLTKV